MRVRSTPRSSLVLAATVLALIATLLTGPAATLARQGSGDWSEWTGVPGPEECVTEPVNAETFIDDLVAAAATPTANDIPLIVASIDDLPAGEEASDEETEGALTTLRELLACVNAGNFGSVLALFTTEGLVTLIFGASGMDAATTSSDDLVAALEFFLPILSAPATPIAQADQAGLVEITDVRKLPDGRILVVSVGDATGSEGEAFAVLEDVDGRWLIDTAGVVGELPTDLGA